MCRVQLLGLVWALIVVCCSPAFSWGVTHRDSTRAACAALPEWQQEVWRDDMGKLVKSYCLLPDQAGGKGPHVEREVRPFLYFDKKGWLLHYFPPESYAANRLRTTRGFEWVVSKIISSLQAGQTDHAARYAGGLAHVLEDASCPIHSLEGPDDLRPIINLVHAPPANDPYMNVWAAFWGGGTPDGKKLLPAGYRPKLLGTSPQEIAWRLYDGYRRVLDLTRQGIIPAIDALYSDRPRTGPEWQRLWDPMAVAPTMLLADAYYTCMCVAFGRVDAQDTEALQRVRIETAYPVLVPSHLAGAYRYTPMVVDVALDRDGKPGALRLRLPQGRTERFERGLSVGAGEACCVSYQIPALVFERLVGWIGLQAGPSQEPGRAQVEVRLNGSPVASSQSLTSAGPALRLDVPASDGGRLDIIIRRSADGLSEAPALVCADTVLVRRADAPVGAGLPPGWEGEPASTPLPDLPQSRPAGLAWPAAAQRAIALAAVGCLPEGDAARFRSQEQALLGAQEGQSSGPVLPAALSDYDRAFNAFRSYVERVGRALHAGQAEQSAGLAGALISATAHRAAPVQCLGDAGGTQYRAFAQLFPAPPDAPYATALAVLPRGMGDVQPDLSGYTPRLLGTSPDEAAFHARQEYVRMVLASCYSLAALVQTRYAGDSAAAERILREMASRPARLSADLLHTAACLAEGRYGAEQVAALSSVDLSRAKWLRQPNYAGGPYRTEPIVFGASLQKEGRKRVPLMLKIVQDGREQVRTFERGMGVGGHRKWAFAFKIPPRVFGELDVHLGMHATLGNVASYGQKHGVMQLQIALGNEVLFDSGILTPDVPGAHAVVDVRQGGMLELRMFDRSGQWANYGNQVVFGEPTLRRAPDAPRGLD